MHRREFLKATAAGSVVPLMLSASAPEAPQTPPGKQQSKFSDRIKPITPEERLSRQEKARRLMHDQGIDALIFEGGVSLDYFTGIRWGRSERLFAMILPRNGEPQFIAPKFEEARALEQVGSARLLTWEEDRSPYDLVKQILGDVKALTGTLAVEETTRFLATDNVRKAIPGLTLVSGTPVTAGCRSVKSAHELELMQVADDITAEVFRSAVKTLREGMTESELARSISKMFSDFGVRGDALVLFGAASASPHGFEKDQTLQNNQIVLIDGGCTVEGYNSDVTRTTVLGTPTDKMKRVWDLVKQAQSAAVKAAAPGVPAEAIDAAARKVITDGGYGPDYRYFTHRVGHGIGMEGHEWYYLVRGNKRPEEVNNTHSDEPGIYIPGEFGIRLEDELLITNDGARLMLPQAVSLEQIFPGD